MKKPPDYREIETNISFSNIKDQVAAFLYATGMIHDNEDVIDIQFDWQFVNSSSIPITLKLKKHQEVEIIKI